MEKWILDNYDKIKNGETYDNVVTFPLKFNNKSRGLYMTVHNANMRNMKVNPDGSLSGRMVDPYDFEEWKLEKYDSLKDIDNNVKTFMHNQIVRTNNRAYEQQQVNRLEPYFISMPITFTNKELESSLKRYKRK